MTDFITSTDHQIICSQDSNQLQGHKDIRDEWLTRQINTLVTMHSQAETQLRDRYNQTLELEVRKYRRKALLARHNLEQDLLREVSNIRVTQTSRIHRLAYKLLYYWHFHVILYSVKLRN